MYSVLKCRKKYSKRFGSVVARLRLDFNLLMFSTVFRQSLEHIRFDRNNSGVIRTKFIITTTTVGKHTTFSGKRLPEGDRVFLFSTVLSKLLFKLSIFFFNIIKELLFYNYYSSVTRFSTVFRIYFVPEEVIITIVILQIVYIVWFEFGLMKLKCNKHWTMVYLFLSVENTPNTTGYILLSC